MTREDKYKVKDFLEQKMMTGQGIERMKGARMKTRTRVHGQNAELQDKESIRTMLEEKTRIKVGNGENQEVDKGENQDQDEDEDENKKKDEDVGEFEILMDCIFSGRCLCCWIVATFDEI